MIRVENIEVWGFEHAIRGMRNPKNSWDKSDSCVCMAGYDDDCDRILDGDMSEQIRCDDGKLGYCVGWNDLKLMQRLYKAGTEHRKYARQIFISMDITAPLYWWKQADQYRIGVTTNSCSTMHKIHAKEFTVDDFSHEHLDSMGINTLNSVIDDLNTARVYYLNGSEVCDIEPHNKNYWWQMIQLLPSSYNQKRTITMNYENVFSMIKQRTGHKLDEWNEFVGILKDLPYVAEITKD